RRTIWYLSVGLSLAKIGDAGRLAVSAADSDYDRERYARRAAEFRGDAIRGQRLMRDAKRTTCLRCHKVGDEGTDVGPNLSNVGGKLAREHLVESILEPSRQIVEGFRGVA